jgi:hypothetical protein
VKIIRTIRGKPREFLRSKISLGGNIGLWMRMHEWCVLVYYWGLKDEIMWLEHKIDKGKVSRDKFPLLAELPFGGGWEILLLEVMILYKTCV